jgi:hypothetical protein
MKTRTRVAGAAKKPVRISIDVQAAEYQAMLTRLNQLRAYLSPKIKVYRLADAAARQRWLKHDALLRSALEWFDPPAADPI